jgi:hypothetical protein
LFGAVFGKNLGRLATDLTLFWEAATCPNAGVLGKTVTQRISRNLMASELVAKLGTRS